MAKFIIDDKPVYRVYLEYNTLFFGFSIRKIDISIDEALSKHLASNTQTLQLNSANTTPQFSGYKTKSTTNEANQAKQEKDHVVHPA